MKFRGTLTDLKARLAHLQVGDDWKRVTAYTWMLRCRDGAVLNYSPTTRSIWCQGPADKKAALEKRVIEILHGMGGLQAKLSSDVIASASFVAALPGEPGLEISQYAAQG